MTIEAENWQVIYGVQTETTKDVGGGLNVGWIDPGNWISYGQIRINAPVSGTNTVEFRVASKAGGGSFVFEENGGSINYSTVSVPSTGN